MATMSYDYLDCGLVVLSHSPDAPSSDDWANYLRFLAPHIARNTPTRAPVRVLVMAAGKGPSSVQRSDMSALPGAVHTPTAVMTKERLLRGLVTALRWLGVKNIRAYAPEELAVALEFLYVSQDQHTLVHRTITNNQARLD